MGHYVKIKGDDRILCHAFQPSFPYIIFSLEEDWMSLPADIHAVPPLGGVQWELLFLTAGWILCPPLKYSFFSQEELKKKKVKTRIGNEGALTSPPPHIAMEQGIARWLGAAAIA